MTVNLCVFPHAPKSLQIQHPAAMTTSGILLLLLYGNDATLLAVCVLHYVMSAFDNFFSGRQISQVKDFEKKGMLEVLKFFKNRGLVQPFQNTKTTRTVIYFQ